MQTTRGHMIVVCAWCEAEGRGYVMTEREPLEDRQVTHTVCLEHRTELLSQLARMPRASAIARPSLAGSSRE
jgi:hypothetical protein